MNVTERRGEPIEAGQGYRILEANEALRSGDEFWSVHTSSWVGIEELVGHEDHDESEPNKDRIWFTFRRRLHQSDPTRATPWTLDEFRKRCYEARDLWPEADQKNVFDADAKLNELRSCALALEINIGRYQRIFPIKRNSLSVALLDWIKNPKLQEAAWNRYQTQISELVQAATAKGTAAKWIAVPFITKKLGLDRSAISAWVRALPESLKRKPRKSWEVKFPDANQYWPPTWKKID